MILQPFELFKSTYLPRLVSLKKVYLVTQSYPRGSNPLVEDLQQPILFTDYEDLGLAKIHLNAIKHDPFASIIDLNNKKHLEKLQEMLSPTSKYRVYWSIIKSAKELQHQINKIYKEQFKRYIDKHTTWRLNREITLYPSLEVTFGELFIHLKHAHQTLRVKFDEIEKA